MRQLKVKFFYYYFIKANCPQLIFFCYNALHAIPHNQLKDKLEHLTYGLGEAFEASKHKDRGHVETPSKQ